jgi:hypothetical protein
MPDPPELERFARLLVTLVRDRAIHEADRLARGGVVGPSGRHWQTVLAESPSSDALRELIPEIVDQTLFQLLDAIDNGALPLGWRAQDGSQTTLQDLGSSEMAGSLVGGDWPRLYSTQPFHNHFANLRLGAEPGDA